MQLKIYNVLATSFLLVVCCHASDDGCPTGDGTWMKYGDNCYNYQATERNVTDAETACQALDGAHLASMHSQAEREYITNTLFTPVSNGLYWIGLDDRESECFNDGACAGWVWTDGTLMTWTDWGTAGVGEPRSVYDCVVLFRTSDAENGFGWWYSRSCADTYFYICKVAATSDSGASSTHPRDTRAIMAILFIATLAHINVRRLS